MSWKTVITARAFGGRGAAWELLQGGGCEAVFAERLGPLPVEALAEALAGADAVLCSPDAFTRGFFQRREAASLKIISRWGVGYDSIDVAAATAAGVVVAYTPGLLDEAVADYAFGLLLTLARHTAAADATMKAGCWEAIWGCDVAGKTLGIVGCGRIGRAVARRAQGFGLRLLGCDVVESASVRALGVEYVPLERLLRESDFVSLHAALTAENRGMMGEAEFRQMKPGALFINTARGAHVQEAALIRALREGWIGGAALDVFAEEPLPKDHPLRSAPNLVLSPHQASNARETGERISRAAAQAIVDLKHGRAPQWTVNPEVFDSAALRASLGASGCGGSRRRL